MLIALTAFCSYSTNWASLAIKQEADSNRSASQWVNCTEPCEQRAAFTFLSESLAPLKHTPVSNGRLESYCFLSKGSKSGCSVIWYAPETSDMRKVRGVGYLQHILCLLINCFNTCCLTCTYSLCDIRNSTKLTLNPSEFTSCWFNHALRLYIKTFLKIYFRI